MPREFQRTDRLREQIKRVLSELVRDELRDPRIGLVSLTDVEVSRDLAHARVFFSVFGDDDMERTRGVLQGAAGMLRSRLGRTLATRKVPQLEFVPDRSLAEGERMDALIAAARKRDADTGG